MKTILMKTSLSDGKTAKRQYTITDKEADKLIEVGFADLVKEGEPDEPGADLVEAVKPEGKPGKRG